mmetsp:Transcript_33797/g.77969  ORF Transcript_33797/g.77969 Transcript_33797/m.77969 type:complete len:322 (+) Transcript_33797:139-1104(+)|eukprot:CAMPEP_0116844060 /NCGR_PEP_ID=MMETSP0418-20121206/12452_1 /TAXON_ID=1158023 /ORGANISM="Astrosyne radiata, Strain 13vi08-1A" /LENGTH=321 /DNA_ID=CAMNT_0004474919 /DNA_START=130 /DNA_END=1095 /DNA_ORIENTATION=+
MEESRNLRTELAQLQESTRFALEDSWKEVEDLHEENEGMKKTIQSLNEQLEFFRKQEKEWKSLVEDLREKLQQQQLLNEQLQVQQQQQQRDQQPPTVEQTQERRRSNLVRRISIGTISAVSMGSVAPLEDDDTDQPTTTTMLTDPCTLKRKLSLGSVGSAYSMDHSVASLESTANQTFSSSPGQAKSAWGLWPTGHRKREQQQKQRLLGDLIQRVSTFEQEKAEFMAESRAMMQCRDSVLESMEQATLAHIQTVDTLKMDLETTKQQAITREEFLQRQIQRLRRKLDDKKRIIDSQRTQMEGFQERIDKLSRNDGARTKQR